MPMASLQTLPLELLEEVDDYLALYGKLALRRTCRRSFYTLSSYSKLVEELHVKGKELHLYQWLIERGSSCKKLACTTCFQLHQPSDFDDDNRHESNAWMRRCSRDATPGWQRRRSILYAAETAGLIGGTICDGCQRAHRMEFFNQNRLALRQQEGLVCTPSQSMVALHPSWIMNFSQFRELERNLVMPSNVDEPTTAELALMDHMYEHDPDLRKMHINLDKSDREFEKRRKTSYRMSDLFVEEEGKDLLGQRLIWRRRGLFRTISSHGKSEIQLLQGFAALKESGSLNAVEPRNLGSKHLDIWLNPLEFFSLKEGGLQVGCIWNFNLVAICNKPPVWKRTEDRTQAITSEIQSKQLDFDLCPHVRVADDRIISAAVQSGLHDCGPCKKEPLNGNISATQRDAAEGELDQGSQSFKEFGEADTESMYEETEDKLNKGPFLSEQDQNNRSKLHLSFIRATDCEKCQTIFKVAITQPREAMVNRDGVYRHFRADHNCLVVAVLRNLGRAETMFNLTWLNHSELHDQHSYTNLRHRSTYQPRICVDYSYPGVRAWGEARTRRLRAGMGIWPH